MRHGDHKYEIFAFISFILRLKDTFCIISPLACYLRLKIPEETGKSAPCIDIFIYLCLMIRFYILPTPWCLAIPEHTAWLYNERFKMLKEALGRVNHPPPPPRATPLDPPQQSLYKLMDEIIFLIDPWKSSIHFPHQPVRRDLSNRHFLWHRGSYSCLLGRQGSCS